MHTALNGQWDTIALRNLPQWNYHRLSLGNAGTHLSITAASHPYRHPAEKRGNATAGMHAVILSLQYIHVYRPITGKEMAAARTQRWKENTRRRIGMVRLRQSNAGTYAVGNVSVTEPLGTWKTITTEQITMGSAQLQGVSRNIGDPEHPRG